LRRSKTRRVVWALVFLSPVLLAAQVLTLTEVSRGSYTLTYQPEGNSVDREVIYERVLEGMTAAVQYEIRVGRTSGSSSAPSRSVYSDDVFYEGFRDQFTGSFALSRNGSTQLFPNDDTFLDEFFSLNNYPLFLDTLSPGEYTVRVRAKLREIKLLPPLNLLAPLQALRWMRLPWTEAAVTIEGERKP